METLDTTGVELYTSYIKARDAWISYIRPRAIQKINDYLSSNGRIYYKYEYYITTEMQNDIQSQSKSADMIAKYKKLCILFHPDKFTHPSSADLFCLLKKWFDANNSYLLDILDRISHLILEIPYTTTQTNNLTNLLANLDNLNITTIIKSKCSNIDDSRCLFDLLNTEPAKLDISSSNSTCQGTSQCEKEDFITTNAYKFFMDEEQTKPVLEKVALTELEIIEYIKEQGTYSSGLLDFYMKRYNDNKNILRAILELKAEKLKKENEMLRARLERLSKKE